MKEAKNIDDSLEFLRSFEKHTHKTGLGQLVLQKVNRHNKSLNLQGNRFTDSDFKKLFSIESLKFLESIDKISVSFDLHVLIL